MITQTGTKTKMDDADLAHEMRDPIGMQAVDVADVVGAHKDAGAAKVDQEPDTPMIKNHTTWLIQIYSRMMTVITIVMELLTTAIVYLVPNPRYATCLPPS